MLCIGRRGSAWGEAPRLRPAAGRLGGGRIRGSALGDGALRQRLLTLARDRYARPQANLPQACETRAKTKAAYRFLEHPDTTMDALLQPHFEATRQRVAAEKLGLRCRTPPA